MQNINNHPQPARVLQAIKPKTAAAALETQVETACCTPSSAVLLRLPPICQHWVSEILQIDFFVLLKDSSEGILVRVPIGAHLPASCGALEFDSTSTPTNPFSGWSSTVC